MQHLGVNQQVLGVFATRAQFQEGVLLPYGTAGAGSTWAQVHPEVGAAHSKICLYCVLFDK